MKRYKLSLTITDEDSGEQFIQLQTPHLPAPTVYDLVMLTLAGIQEPEPPEILTTVSAGKPRTVRKRKIRNLLAKRPAKPDLEPPGFDGQIDV